MKTVLRCCLGAALFAFSGLPFTALAQDQEVRLPYPTYWPLIPENQGIKFFLGKWYPTFNQDFDAYNYLIFREDGQIVYGNNYPTEGFYKVIGTGRNFALLFVKEHDFALKHHEFTSYEFVLLHAPPSDIAQKYPDQPSPDASGDSLWMSNCGVYFSPQSNESRKPNQLSEDDWQLPPEKLRELWDRYYICNPNLSGSGSSPGYPLGKSWGVDKFQRAGRDFKPTRPPWPGK